LISFIDFRVNRLLEKIGKKPSYSDCLNQVYDSVGWEMNKFYLDMMGLSLSIKKIHFMLTVIPLVHQLDDNYPLIEAHKKLKEYAKQRNLEFLDFYDEGFKNLDSNTLRISETDHHLNEFAGDIMVNSLFKKINPLVNFKNISYFNKAFTLKEILNKNPLLIKLDNKFNKTKIFNKFILNSETEALQITKDTNQFIVKKIYKTKNGNTPTSLSETNLSLLGNYIGHEKVYFHKNSKTPKLRERFSHKSGIYTETIERIEPSSKGNLVAIQLGQRNFEFGFEGSEHQYRIKLESNIMFPDPKVLDKWIFQNIHPPSDENSKEKQREILIQIIEKNKNLYGMLDDIKIIDPNDPFGNLSDEDLSSKFNEQILFQTFLILGRYGAKNYATSLILLIEQIKPSLSAVNTAKRYRKFFMSPNNN
jgi:hypothetical protein